MSHRRRNPNSCLRPCLSSYLCQDHIPTKDATVVEQILDVGGRIVGKANMGEFELGGDVSTIGAVLAHYTVLHSHCL